MSKINGTQRRQKTQAKAGGKQLPVGSSSLIAEANNPVVRNKALIEGQRYVPGLHTKEDAEVLLPQTITKSMARVLPKDVPEGLYEDFLSGTKHPVSCLMEYCASTRLVATFREAPVKNPSIVAKFACVCSINTRDFPQGTGKTKKDAKTEAARIAFTMLLGIDQSEQEDEGGETLYDTKGTKIRLAQTLTAEYSAPKPNEFAIRPNNDNQNLVPKIALPSTQNLDMTPHWDAPKHPVQIVNEYCAKRQWDVKITASDNKTSYGFHAKVVIEEEIVGEAYAHNKKEAKKKAAEEAIKNFLPSNYSELVDCDRSSQALSCSDTSSIHSMSGVSAASLGACASDSFSQYSQSFHDLSGQGSVADSVSDAEDWVTQLKSFCRTHRYTLSISVSDYPGPDGYESRVLVGGEEWAFSSGKSRKAAKEDAARTTLINLQSCTESDTDTSQTKDDEGTFYDVIRDVAWAKFSDLLGAFGQDPKQNVPMAAFIVRRCETDRGEVVALGTGSTCLVPGAVPTDGRTLVDSHAPVLARRGFMKYLFRELTLHYQGVISPVHSIFEEQPGKRTLRVKENITFHLYLSHAPSGDAHHFTPRKNELLTEADVEIMESGLHHPDFSEDNHGMLRVKSQAGFKTDEVKKLSPGEVRIMSCSDKILKWNSVGLQGSLLTHYIEPVYLYSITLGFMYNHGHLARAVSGRVTEDLDDVLPSGYTSNYPFIGRVTHYDRETTFTEPTVLSFNWSLGDQLLEITDGSSGKSTMESPFRTGASNASRLAKAGFLYRCRDLSKYAKRPDILEYQTYQVAKAAAKAYQEAKAVFYAHVSSHGFGNWNRHPPNCQHFCK